VLKTDQIGQMTLTGPDGRLSIMGRVVWIRRRGLRQFMLGIQFLHTTPKHTRALDNLATFGLFRVRAPGVGSGRASESCQSEKPNKLLATVQLPDYYNVLGVEPGADDEHVQTAYRKQASQWHPDVCRHPDALERMRLINEAYSVLRNPHLRATYDLRAAG
jgi:hypothetical protein